MAGMYSEKSESYFAQTRSDIGPLLPGRASKVLEVGCGAGMTMQWLRTEMAVDYAVGIEMDPSSATNAASAFDLVLTGNAEILELPDLRFDLIIILDVLEHLMDPWAMVQKLHAILAPGGIIIASIPNIGHYSIVSGLLRGQWDYVQSGLLDRTHLRFFTKKTAIALMSCPGLVVQKTDRVLLDFPCLARTSKRVRWYAKKLAALAVPDHLVTYQFLIRSARLE